MAREKKLQTTEYYAAPDANGKGGVAGSTNLFEFGDKRILFEAGMRYQHGEHEDPFPIDPKTIDSVVFGHSHLDHIGGLLKLEKEGYNGPIYSTYQSADIAQKQWQGIVSGPHIHNRMVKGKKDKSGNWIPFEKVNYEYDGFKNLCEMLAYEDEKGDIYYPNENRNKRGKKKDQLGVPYGQKIQIEDGVDITFYEAGHIPGSAQVLWEFKKGKKTTKVLTTYDLGRTDYKITDHPIANIPIVKYPETEIPDGIDHIFIESTYKEDHTPLSKSVDTLVKGVNDAYDRDGKLIISAFTIQRTPIIQNFMYRLFKNGKIPDDMPFILSSPGAHEMNKITMKHPQDWDEKSVQELIREGDNVFDNEYQTVHKKLEDTLDFLESGDANPSVLLMSSGMRDFGRVKVIDEREISDPRNILMLTGYAAPGTRAFQMKNGAKEIEYLSGMVPLEAEVRVMRGTSGHADPKENLAHIKNVDPDEKVKTIFIKHGEKEACEAQRKYILENTNYDPSQVVIMQAGKTYDLD